MDPWITMMIASAILGFAIVVIMRKGFRKLPTGLKIGVVVIVAFMATLLFPEILNNPSIEGAMAMVNAGRDWAANVGLSAVGFLIGAAGGLFFPKA